MLDRIYYIKMLKTVCMTISKSYKVKRFSLNAGVNGQWPCVM